jgi:transmembrane sensor
MDWRMLPSEHLVSEATEWFARIHDPDLPASTREEFTRWVLQSPAHIAAFLRVTRAWGDIGLAGENMPSLEELVSTARIETDQSLPGAGLPSNVIALPGFSQSSADPAVDEPKRPWLQRRWKAVAAVAAAIIIAIPTGWLAADRWLNPSHIRTAIGEQRSIALADGSLVQLNTNSELRIDLKPHERRIILRRGEARFTVAKDPNRPFLVETPQATVRALGTVFNVQIARQGTDVAVLEGHVEVTRAVDKANDPVPSALPSPAELAEHEKGGSSEVRPKKFPKLSTQRVSATRLVLASGERAAVTQEGKILPDAGPPLERVVGWTDRRLVFREETLATLIAEVNRYHEKPIRIVDPEIAGLRISGTFAAYDLPSLIEYLERYRGVKSNPAPDGGVELSSAE